MRPVTRGEYPASLDGTPKVFAHYRDARLDLVARLGAYCSYCEQRLTHGAHVEHVRPKSLHPDLECEWGNLLLGCANCNDIKGDADVVLDEHAWPDLDNTAAAYEYDGSGRVSVRTRAEATEEARARRTHALVDLDRPESPTDRRRALRREAWGKAERARTRLSDVDSQPMRDQIAEMAAETGFFSIWMTVFREDADMCRRFIEAFQGTDKQCFDAQTYQPVDEIERPWLEQ